MKTSKGIYDLDQFSFKLSNYIEGLFGEDYIIDRSDMDYKFKKQVIEFLGDSYINIYKLLVNRILNEQQIDTIVVNLTNDVWFLLAMLEQYSDIVLELPIHYLTIITYIHSRIVALEKYEILANLQKFWIKWEQKLIENKWVIPVE